MAGVVSSTGNHQPTQNEEVGKVHYFSPINGPNQYFSILRLTQGNQPLLVEAMLDASRGKELDSHVAYFLEVAAKVGNYTTTIWPSLYFVRAFDRTFGRLPFFLFSLREKKFSAFAQPSTTELEFVSKTFSTDKGMALFPVVKFSIQWVFSKLLPNISENSLDGSTKKVREANLYFQESLFPYFHDYLTERQIRCEKEFSFLKIRISDLLQKTENPPALESPCSKRASVSVKIEVDPSKRSKGS